MSDTTDTPGEESVVILVHGAFAESASWNGVIADLQRRGRRVVAVANPLRGLKPDAAYLRSVIDGFPVPVVLAGHSYGGSVMSEAADGATNVKALVYIASFHLEPGESTGQLAAKFPGGELGPALDPVPFPLADGGTGTDLYIKPDRFHDVFAADVDPDVARLMAATQRPIAASALEDIATRAAWRTIPSWAMITTQDLAIPADSMRFMAERAGSTTVEIDASHAVTVSQPEAVAQLIDDAVRSTGGSHMTSVEPIEPTDLPATIRSYLAAHAAGDVDRALGAFSPDAVVIDEQRTYAGIDEVLVFLRNAGSQFTYTTQLAGAGRLDDHHWVAVNHLEGDFPGGTVDLTYRFTIHGDRITELVIAP